MLKGSTASIIKDIPAFVIILNLIGFFLLKIKNNLLDISSGHILLHCTTALRWNMYRMYFTVHICEFIYVCVCKTLTKNMTKKRGYMIFFLDHQCNVLISHSDTKIGFDVKKVCAENDKLQD